MRNCSICRSISACRIARPGLPRELTLLPCKVRQVKQADIVSNKRLGAVLKHVQEQQQIQAVERSKKAPARRGQRRSASERFREANPAVG
jgi:hypothetical protein